MAYTNYVRNPNTKRYCLVFLFFALGLMSKPMLVSLPFLFLLLDYWPLGRFPGVLGQGDQGEKEIATVLSPLRVGCVGP